MNKVSNNENISTSNIYNFWSNFEFITYCCGYLKYINDIYKANLPTRTKLGLGGRLTFVFLVFYFLCFSYNKIINWTTKKCEGVKVEIFKEKKNLMIKNEENELVTNIESENKEENKINFVSFLSKIAQKISSRYFTISKRTG
jgi:hypothetical protein